MAGNAHYLFAGLFAMLLLGGCAGVHLSMPSNAQIKTRDAQCFVELVRPKWSVQRSSYFGEAAPEVQRYTVYWRQHFRKKRKQNRQKDDWEETAWFNAVLRCPDQWLSHEVFRDGVRILHKAVVKNLDRDAKQRVQELILRHEHAVLTYRTLSAEADADDAGEEEEKQADKLRTRLREFRERFRKYL